QYMSPEAISNEVLSGAGHLVDLYALGIVAFEMLTGDVPFNSDEILEVWEKHLTAEVPDVRRLRPDIPASLASLVMSLVIKDPTERPQSIETVAWQLKQIRDNLTRMTAAATVPAATPPVRAARPAAAEVKPGLSVLIVDDSRELQRVLSFYVKKVAPDADIRVVDDGDTAIEAVRQREPDLMLLDLQMPRMNGIEVVMYLRGFGLAEATIIASVSAGAQEHDVQLLQQLGITRFLTKGSGMQPHIEALVREAKTTHNR
ncbi:MAG: response regulator, partial [Myxococcales bacterium]